MADAEIPIRSFRHPFRIQFWCKPASVWNRETRPENSPVDCFQRRTGGAQPGKRRMTGVPLLTRTPPNGSQLAVHSSVPAEVVAKTGRPIWSVGTQ
jgi:hypothetical protein